MIKMVPDADKLTDRVLNPESFRDMAESFTKEQLFQMIDTLNRYQSEMKYAVQPQTLFEVALLKLCSIPAQGGVPNQAAVSAGATASSQADSGEINRLKQQLAELEKKLDRALKSGLSGGEAAPSSPSRSATRAPVSRGSAPAKLPAQLDQYVARKGSPEFVEISRKWSQILQRVKEEKVTVHAWFMDGEPVSMLEDNVLVAFKNNIHRETTEKQANREVIERVLSEQLGRSARLVTMMLKDWTGAMEGAAEAPKEDFKLEPEHEDGGSGSKQPWIDEAIQLFGEDLVVIKE
jgi:DNA polymerase-3 subunit gamma/tau